MTTFTQIIDDNFNRADTVAGTVTGPATFASPSTGAAYVDPSGSIYKITTNVLTTPGATPNGYITSPLVRPTSENIQDGKVVVTTAGVLNGATNPVYTAVARWQTGSNLAYIAYVYGGGAGTVGTMKLLVMSGTTILATLGTAAVTFAVGQPYILTLTATGTSPTTLTATLANASTPGTIIQTLTGTDSTAGLQTAGQWGLSTNGVSSTSGNFTHLTTYSASGAAPALAYGNLTAAATVAGGVTLSLDAALSGGSGSGYNYKIWRDTQPSVSTAGTPFATPSSFPWTDGAALPGVTYYYAVQGLDGSGATTAIPPAGSGSITPANVYPLAVAVPPAIVNLVSYGDSITYGARTTTPGGATAPPAQAAAYLQSKGIETYVSNQGHTGATTTDCLPGGSYFTALESAATTLQAAHPAGQLLFSIRLGNNDSAFSGANGSALSPSAYIANLTAIINRLRTDFPAAKVMLHKLTWYSPNTLTSYNYENGGPARLVTYNAAIDTIVAANSGFVLLGETSSYVWSAATYLTTFSAESGSDGTYYLHTNDAGAKVLGQFEGAAIHKGLFSTGTTTVAAIPPLTRAQAAVLIAKGVDIVWKGLIYGDAAALPAEFV